MNWKCFLNKFKLPPRNDMPINFSRPMSCHCILHSICIAQRQTNAVPKKYTCSKSNEYFKSQQSLYFKRGFLNNLCTRLEIMKSAPKLIKTFCSQYLRVNKYSLASNNLANFVWTYTVKQGTFTSNWFPRVGLFAKVSCLKIIYK